MRNKGFFWFLTILLTAVCLYQLSFTVVSNSVEKKAEKSAEEQVATYREAAKATGDSTIINGRVVKFNTPEGEEIAKSLVINQILKEKAETKVYPVLGSTFSQVKNRSLAFGLDLVGGMSVTMEISIPELIRSYARNVNDQKFKRVFDAAKAQYDRKGGDFVEIFIDKHNELNKGLELVRLFSITDNEGLNTKSTDSDVEKFLKDKVTSSMSGVEEILNRRINQFGVSQPNIQKDPTNNRLYVELPGVQDEATVAKQLVSTANLQFFETFKTSAIANEWNQIMFLSTQEEVAENVEVADSSATSDSTGVEGDTSEVASLNDAPKSLDEEVGSLNGSKKGLADLLPPVGDFALGFALPENRSAVDMILARKDIRRAFPENMVVMWSADLQKGLNDQYGYFLYAIRIPADGKARVGGRDIQSANPDINQEGKRTVTLKMTSEGADKWSLMTSENVGNIIAITMDSVVYSAPNVINQISQGNTEITGNFSFEEATRLSGLLNGGALPAPLVIKEQTKVGPTIGAENTRSGLISFGIALLVVFLYMLFYYGKAGVVADIALIANILFIFGSLASFGAVLTLAGIAGIVLTIGMAVDANVLIFERIREEEMAGKDKKSAIDTGFKKALSSIIDANVTTLLTAIVLKVFGSGPIESFATTLIIGIFTSMFAALVISRLIITWWVNKGRDLPFDTKVTKGAFKNINFDFVGKRKIFYVISGLLIAGGIVALLTKGLNPSVEFSGGRTYGVKFEQSAEGKLEKLEANIKKAFGTDGGKSSLMTKTKSSSYFVEITTNYRIADESANNVVVDKLKEAFENSKDFLGAYEIEESRSVSATVSEELKSSSFIAIILSLIIIFAYILIRFGKWQYSTGALLAMAHDVLIVLAVFAAFHGIMPFNMDIDQAFIAAILTVIGYSINDTVIVFDRIRENLGMHSNKTQGEEINGSLNSTLSRTINTSVTTFIVLLIIFIFGGAAIKGFVFALMIGVVVGTYSSLCIATPLLIDLSKKIKA